MQLSKSFSSLTQLQISPSLVHMIWFCLWFCSNRMKPFLMEMNGGVDGRGGEGDWRCSSSMKPIRSCRRRMFDASAAFLYSDVDPPWLTALREQEAGPGFSVCNSIGCCIIRENAHWEREGKKKGGEKRMKGSKASTPEQFSLSRRKAGIRRIGGKLWMEDVPSEKTKKEKQRSEVKWRRDQHLRKRRGILSVKSNRINFYSLLLGTSSHFHLHPPSSSDVKFGGGLSLPLSACVGVLACPASCSVFHPLLLIRGQIFITSLCLHSEDSPRCCVRAGGRLYLKSSFKFFQIFFFFLPNVLLWADEFLLHADRSWRASTFWSETEESLKFWICLMKDETGLSGCRSF